MGVRQITFGQTRMKTNSYSSIAEVYIGLITACMPFLPAFWKHHFGARYPTDYARYGYSTGRSIEINLQRLSKRRGTVTNRRTTDFGSDENILITDAPIPPANTYKRSSAHQAHQEDISNKIENIRACPSPTVGRKEAQILKTVEIKHTFE